METLRACPKARYEDGLDTAKSDVLAGVLRQIGCTQAAEILTEPAAEAQAKQRIAEGADCFGQFTLDGLQAT
ncbi:metal ABC transporter substrate-binding protein [Eikenella corrodens]|uniref:metal ABC transporter substrate-binding protein n=1 Tax=Eikenella corrodens TaxID=539 RepID=UPI000665EDE8|nr:metal ABC transporter substrate-binding protein [Eikenella corrodens]